MIHYQDDNHLFSASSIVAFFGDGVEVSLDTVTLRASTPMGEEWILSRDSAEEEDERAAHRVVRLITITPDKDWRQNNNNNAAASVSYAWKLDNAWMSDPDDLTAWLHWNSNSYIDSVLQVPTGDDPAAYLKNTTTTTTYQMLSCNVMEFHFDAILPSGFRRSTDPIVTDTRVVLKNVKMGSNLQTIEEKYLHYYDPCTGQSSMGKHDSGSYCAVVDGAVSSTFSSFSGWTRPNAATFLNDSPVWEIVLFVGILLGMAVLLWYLVGRLFQCCCHWQRTKRYQQINSSHDEDDLALAEEEEENDDDDQQ